MVFCKIWTPDGDLQRFVNMNAYSSTLSVWQTTLVFSRHLTASHLKRGHCWGVRCCGSYDNNIISMATRFSTWEESMQKPYGSSRGAFLTHPAYCLTIAATGHVTHLHTVVDAPSILLGGRLLGNARGLGVLVTCHALQGQASLQVTLVLLWGHSAILRQVLGHK
eukprot:1003796-Amphidinium_carterae.1